MMKKKRNETLWVTNLSIQQNPMFEILDPNYLNEILTTLKEIITQSFSNFSFLLMLITFTFRLGCLHLLLQRDHLSKASGYLSAIAL
jgi:hypothetical protein